MSGVHHFITLTPELARALIAEMQAVLDGEAFRTALWELGIPAQNALAITGSAAGLRAATASGLASVVITGDGAPEIPAALAVRPDYAGTEPMRMADCQRLHGRWFAAHKPADAA